jgi:hypothetical protein
VLVYEGLVCVCDAAGCSREDETDEEIDNGNACSDAGDIGGSAGISFCDWYNTCSPPVSSVPSSRRTAFESSRSSSDSVKAPFACGGLPPVWPPWHRSGSFGREAKASEVFQFVQPSDAAREWS